MKNLILLAFLLFAANAMSAEAPKYLEDAVITVTLADGKTYTFDAKEYAVVPRDQMGQGDAAIKTLAKVEEAFDKEIIVPNKKNRIYILGGYGNTGDLDSSTNGKNYSVEQDKGAVGGVGYQRKLNNTLNIGIQVQTNSTGSLSLGADF